MRGNAKKYTESLAIPHCAKTNKLAFQSRSQAKRFSKRLKYLPGSRPQREYVCRYCGTWHLTKASPGGGSG